MEKWSKRDVIQKVPIKSTLNTSQAKKKYDIIVVVSIPHKICA